MRLLLLAVMAVATLAGCASSTASSAQLAKSSSPAPRAVATVQVSPPSPSPGTGIKLPSPSPSPAGTPVAAEILAPAKVMPAVALCTTPVQAYQDGNAGPLFCRNGALNVAVWNWFESSLHPAVMAAGPGRSATAQEAALCARNGGNMTNPELRARTGWRPLTTAGSRSTSNRFFSIRSVRRCR